MIVCTRSLDAVAGKAFGKKNVAISTVDKMIETFQLDPAVSGSTVEAFLIGDSDVRNKKLKQKFLTAAVTKHPAVNVIYVVRGSKSDVTEGNGINIVLIKPSPEELQSKVYAITENITNKEEVVSSAETVPQGVEGFKPKGLMRNMETPVDEIGMPTNGADMEQLQQELEALDMSIAGSGAAQEQESVPVEEEAAGKVVLEKVNLDKDVEPQPMDETQATSEMIERVRRCSSVCDLAVLTREFTATNLIKDIVKSNQQYVNIEDRLKAIREKMLAVYADPSIRSQEEKLDKIKALTYDKDRYMSESNTIIEQRVEELIALVIDKTRECLHSRLNELDRAIVNVKTDDSAAGDFTRIAGINDERANLILELQVLDKEIRDIFAATHDMAVDISSSIADQSAAITDSPLLNARLRLQGTSVVSDKSRETIMHILTTAERTSDEFKDASRELVIMNQKLNKLIELDKEQIAAMAEVIAFLRANNVEDTVIKESLIKKSLRIFVADEGSGRSVVPYMLSKFKSRENCNVLYIDITGKNKVDCYGDKLYTLDEWMANRYEKEFCGVQGYVGESVEAAQRFMAALVKAADYYRVINVVMSPEQRDLFGVIAPDVLVVNYIVDTSSRSLAFYRDFIKDTKYPNVAQRVIVNKCDIPVRPILEKLDVIEAADIHVAVIPSIPAITECSLREVRPYELTSVQEAFREVRKVC